MSECIDGIALENLDYCPTDEITPGVSETGVFAAMISEFDTIAKPKDLKEGATLEEIATIAEAHTFKEGKGFHKIQLIPDTGLVETETVGEKGMKSFANSFSGEVRGTGAKNAGWLRKYRNVPMIFIVREKDGNVKQIGSELSPAYVTDPALSSGQSSEDKKMTEIKISDVQNYPAPEYAGTIEEFDALP